MALRRGMPEGRGASAFAPLAAGSRQTHCTLRLWQPAHGRPTAQARHNRLCVVNPVGRLVGIITSSDIVRLALAEEASV